MTQKKGHVGSSFEDYLAAEGTLEETNAIAVRRVLRKKARSGPSATRQQNGKSEDNDDDSRHEGGAA